MPSELIRETGNESLQRSAAADPHATRVAEAHATSPWFICIRRIILGNKMERRVDDVILWGHAVQPGGSVCQPNHRTALPSRREHARWRSGLTPRPRRTRTEEDQEAKPDYSVHVPEHELGLVLSAFERLSGELACTAIMRSRSRRTGEHYGCAGRFQARRSPPARFSCAARRWPAVSSCRPDDDADDGEHHRQLVGITTGGAAGRRGASTLLALLHRHDDAEPC